MSTGTRAARAATSRHVKQEIVRLLFSSKYSKTGPENHRLLDYSIYSYGDLKKAYLERLQEIHPDKLKNQQNQQQQTMKNNNSSIQNNNTQYFHELQSAWKKYDEIAKAMKIFSSNNNNNNNNNNEESNFTKFGVGCSFSDNEEERALRNEITDQACRGWFASGALTAGGTGNTTNSSFEKEGKALNDPISPCIREIISLVDDDMFMEESSFSEMVDNNKSKSQVGTVGNDDKSSSSSSQFKTLIPGMKIIRKT